MISVTGYFIEKFINLCANKGIYLWNIKRNYSNSMTLNVSVKGFKAIKGIARKTKCKVKIIRKIGFPFVKYRYRKRKSFLLGFTLFFAIIYILTRFIWVIEINGLKTVKSQEILDFLAHNGIKPGIIKYKFDKDIIIPNMLISINGISWADINIVGTKVVVDVVERIPKPEIVDRSQPCNVYAKNSGVITNMITTNGVAVVKEGDVVKKGQMLITGIVPNKFKPLEPLFVHADGVINATVWYEDVSYYYLTRYKYVRDGNYKASYDVKVFDKLYNIWGKRIQYKNYETEEKVIKLGIWKNYEFPIDLVVKKNYNLINKKFVYTEDQVKNEAKVFGSKKTQQLVPKEDVINEKKFEFDNIDQNTVACKTIFQCTESIGYKEKIQIE